VGSKDRKMSEYKKYCYWLDSNSLKKAKESLRKIDIESSEEDRIPCRVLRTSIEIGYVVPAAWEGFCKRRTSWHRKSQKAKKFLMVSNFPVDLPDFRNSVIITESNFKPDRLPSSEGVSQLIKSKKYQTQKPSEWDKPDPLEREFYQRWFGRQQRKEPFDFDKILLSHSANHANFIDPKFFIDLNGTIAPYSIADSIHVCSSCIEFFNILGEQWIKKYVVPCIGAVQFAHLPMDRYFEVEIYKNNDATANND
jgi:hypothetical protein